MNFFNTLATLPGELNTAMAADGINKYSYGGRMWKLK